MVKHAAATITRYLVRDCGNTSYKLIKGRESIEPIAEFGEIILFKPPLTGAEKAHKESWRDRFVDGVYMGSLIRTSENLIGTAEGVFKVTTLRRRPIEERWSRMAINGLCGCPQHRAPGKESFRIPTYVWLEIKEGEAQRPAQEYVPPAARHEDDGTPQYVDFMCARTT